MFFAPSPIGKKTLDEEKLKTDKQGCRKFGPCGVGKEALYLGGRFIDRRYYIPWKEVKRVFKRVAMSAGGFSGKGLFGSMAFFVVPTQSMISLSFRLLFQHIWFPINSKTIIKRQLYHQPKG